MGIRWSAPRLLLLVALLSALVTTRADGQPGVTPMHQGAPTMATRGWPVAPSQGFTLLNTAPVTSAANTATTFPVTGATSFRVCIRAIYIFSSAAGAPTLTLQDGATVIDNWGTLSTSTAFTSIPIPASGICGTTGNSMTVNIGAAGAAVTTTTSVVADRS